MKSTEANRVTGDYSNTDVFTNCNEIKKLASDINMVDILNITPSVCAKLMEIVARARCLNEFEILPDGEQWFGLTSIEKARRE